MNTKVKILVEVEGCKPEKNNLTDIGYDLKAADGYVVNPGQTVIVSAGFKMALPKEENYIWEAQVRPRSGMSAKSGMRVANAPGSIDADYRGTVGVIMHNTGEDKYYIEKGDKIAQMVITRVPITELEEVEVLDETERGEKGFGSSGR